MTPIRLTAVLTHPIQYYAPWFRQVTAAAPELSLTVVHAVTPTPEQQGVGFGRAFTWDVPLTDGYRSVTVRSTRAGERIDSQRFTGVDVPEIGAAVASTKPDVVLITGWYSITLVRALFACRRLRIPTLYRGDSHLLAAPGGWRRPLWVAKTWWLLRQFDGFLSPGIRVHDYLRSFGVLDDRIFAVPHGIDNDMFAAAAARFQRPDDRAVARGQWDIAADAFVPLFVGKLVTSKRPLSLVRAAARLGAGVTVVIAGTGALEPDLRKEASRLGVDVRFVGFLNQTELGKAYAVADCLTLPSDFPETWGLVVNEALACGLPAVVSDAVGCGPDLIRNGETGFTFPLDNVAALAERLGTVRDRKARGHDWSPACRATVGRFSYPIMTEGLVRACQSVLPPPVGVQQQWQESS
ncbi:MAG TPA: glycosyltransferase [Vicinamibacterales bacterium]|jgi:glycosyltransferase involved in cell wall biosynthesis|nr:glycosyltransferase [Vicinamibacterales bacterium]